MSLSKDERRKRWELKPEDLEELPPAKGIEGVDPDLLALLADSRAAHEPDPSEERGDDDDNVFFGDDDDDDLHDLDHPEDEDTWGEFERREPEEREASPDDSPFGSRLALRDVYRPVLRNLTERIVKRQVEHIRALVAEHLGRRDEQSFETQLERYLNDLLQPQIARTARPVFTAYMAAVEREVLDELGQARLDETQDSFVEKYAEGFAAGYIGRSLGQIRQLLRDAEPGADLENLILTRLAEWLERRADKVADYEAVRAGEASAHNTYKRGGITRLKWANHGRKDCPYCRRLEGRTVGIQEHFASDGEHLDGEGEATPMRVFGNRSHPPLHAACNCSVTRA